MEKTHAEITFDCQVFIVHGLGYYKAC